MQVSQIVEINEAHWCGLVITVGGRIGIFNPTDFVLLHKKTQDFCILRHDEMETANILCEKITKIEIFYLTHPETHMQISRYKQHFAPGSESTKLFQVEH